jgi:chromosomal replication initiator protein
MLAHYMIYPGLAVARKRELLIDEIIRVVCDNTQISRHDVMSKSRKREYVDARHYIFYITYNHCNMSLVAIGKHIGFRDHTTVISGRDKIRDLIDYDKKVAQDIKELKQRLHL